MTLCYVRRKPCIYLASRLALSPNRLKQVTTWASSPRSTIGCIPKWFLIYVSRKPCTYLALTLILSPNGLKQDSTRPISPRRSIGCVQNNFWACATFGTNLAPFLCHDQLYLQTDQNEHPRVPRHLGVPSSTSKMLFEPMVRSTQTVHLSCVKISTISK
jgi:hypothetical protein